MGDGVILRHGDEGYMWEQVRGADGKHGYCFWCAPERYPAVPPGWMICARCGALYATDEKIDQELWMEGLYVCKPCDERED